MDIKANVSLYTKPEGNLKGLASISIDDDFIVRGLRIVEGENGLFVAMPSQKSGDGYRDVCFPKTHELREQIHKVVLEAYEQTLKEHKDEIKQDKKTEKGQKRSSGRSQKNAAGNQQEADENALSSEGQDEQVEEGPAMSM